MTSIFLSIILFLQLYMPSILKKQPNCPYGNRAKYVCVNRQCRKPGLICEKGEQGQNQCWLFHENCTKVKWSEIQVFSKENTLSKTPQFMHLQDKVQNLFLKTLQKIQSQHEKFKIWAKTYGHNLQTMKFIKVLMDKNYEQLTGDYMASMMPILLNKDQKKIQTPVIIETELQMLRSQIDRVIERVGSLYMKTKRTEKPSLYSEHSNQTTHSTIHNFSHPTSYTASMGTNSYNFLHNTTTSINSTISKQFSTKESSKEVINTGDFKSKIIDSLTPIEGFFEGKVIKSAKLIYRASEQNFSIKKFHQLCDNIPDTLTLIHNEFNKKIGGYTPVAWTSDKKHWVADKSLKSFIFSIDMNEKFKLNLAQFAIASNPERGPTFGCCDICVVDNSNKEKSNCEFPISYNSNGKYVRSQNTSIQFTGHSKGQFLVKDWEIFRLQFE